MDWDLLALHPPPLPNPHLPFALFVDTFVYPPTTDLLDSLSRIGFINNEILSQYYLSFSDRKKSSPFAFTSSSMSRRAKKVFLLSDSFRKKSIDLLLRIAWILKAEGVKEQSE